MTIALLAAALTAAAVLLCAMAAAERPPAQTETRRRAVLALVSRRNGNRARRSGPAQRAALIRPVEAMAACPAQTLAAALAAGARLPGPHAAALRGAACRLAAGDSPAEALQPLTALGPEAAALAIIAEIAALTGGPPQPALARLAALLAAQQAGEAKRRALSAEGRLSAWIIGALPVAYLAAAQAVSPAYIAPLFESAAGHTIIAGAAAWLALGVATMHRMAATR